MNPPPNGLINLKKSDHGKKIYRVMKLESFFQLVRDRRVFFSRPDFWPDKHENIFLTQNIKVGGESIGIGFKHQFYGQCWSLCKESDALWRLYGDDGCGVKISTSISTLYKALKAKHHFSYVGRVQYLSIENLKKAVLRFIDDGEMNFLGESQAVGPAKTLLYKRVAYRHEQEIRALIFDADNKNRNESGIEANFDPCDVIEQVTFGPRLEANSYQKFKADLESLGFNKPIVRSALYDIPKF